MALAPAAKRAAPAPENFLCETHLKLAPNNELKVRHCLCKENSNQQTCEVEAGERYENQQDGINVVAETVFQRPGSAEKTKMKQVDEDDDDDDDG